MLSDILDHEDGASLAAEFVVVGSGIAGAEVAAILARAGRDVLLLESGRERFDPAIQALNDVEYLGKPQRAIDPDADYHRYLPPPLRGASRVRQLGGTSNVWTGKWKHLQRGDFPGRDWVPHSAWPIDLDALLPHYRSAAADYGFADLEAEAERPPIAALRRAIAPAGLKLTSFHWEATPTRTAGRFGDLFRRADRLRVVTGATATELVSDPSGGRVEAIVARSLEGRRIVARGAVIVLAAGAIETARLMLASTRHARAGVGNAHDLVGRYYGDHPKHHTGDLAPGPTTRAFARELQYGPKPRCCVCFALADDVQRARRLLEHVIYLRPLAEPRWRAPFRRALRRPVAVDEHGPIASYRVKFVVEQTPNPDSRVTLAQERDALGMPKARLDWRFVDADHASLAATVELAERCFPAAGLGRFTWPGGRPSLDTMTDAAHAMGTTRMGRSPAEGVVDADCRVFGTTNLFVAGAAVFPTCPSYSPTFTILALARRLAGHLVGATTRTAAIGR